jgi:outer membrane protein assembly factor BamB
MTERPDISTKRSGPLGTSGGAWRLLILSVVLIMILPLGASAFMFHADPQHTGIFSDGGTHPNNVTLWNYSFGGFQYLNATNFTYIIDNSTYASPAVVNGVVYEGSLGNNMTAFNAATGAKIWDIQVGGDIHSSAAVANNIVYFASYDGFLYAIDATTHANAWGPVNLGAASHSSPAVVGGVVYVGSDKGNISAYNAATGSLMWTNRTNTTPMSGMMHSSPAVAGNVVYVGSENGNLYALNAITGATIWNTNLGASVQSSPAVVGNVVYVGYKTTGNGGQVSALNATDGTIQWQSTATGNEIISSPAVANNVVYFGSGDHNVYAVSTANGAGVSGWPFTTGGIVISSPAVANGTVYFGSYDGNVYAIDVNGTKKWSYSAPSNNAVNWIYSSPAVANGVVYIGGGEGNTQLFAIGNLTAVVQAPVAAFLANPTSGTAPLAVQFNDTSSNTPTAWNWSFRNVTPGNNTQVWFSTVQTPTHTFGVGNYSIVLNASNSAGSNLSTQVTFINVTAIPAPVVNATATTGVYRPGVGFYLKMDNGSTWNPSTDAYRPWDNAAVDLPVAGDWNANGQSETGVYRPGVGFYLKMDNGSTWNGTTDRYLPWDNAAVDLPIAGDWNADGRTETGVYRPGVGFYLKMDNGTTWNGTTDRYLPWDNAAVDRPVAGDWNADGRTETGVYRPGVGFYLKMDNGTTWNGTTDRYLPWDNAAVDLPIAGKFT